ncbi:MAG: hypothetical protein LBH76_08910 [Propionibacteriaceae bacterium]|jgi:hypothetical protein|nr:hypothetical protein [Propionibacteriaceae bacterium]
MTKGQARTAGRLLTVLAAAAAVLGGTVLPAAAEPNTVAEAQAEFDEARRRLDETTQRYDETRDRLEAARHEVEVAAATGADQAARIESLRVQVVQLALEEWQSRGLRSTASLLAGGDGKAMLDQFADSRRLAESTEDLIQRYRLEQAAAQDQRRHAEAVAAQVAADEASLAALKAEAEAEAKTAQRALSRLQAVDGRATAIRSRQVAAVSLAGFPTTDRFVGADTGLRLHVIQVRQIVAALYPEIVTIGGYRAGDWGEHGRGLALDVMIPGWGGAGAELGAEIAAWFQTNSGALGVDYIIWRQRFWQVGMSGWQPMGDRGSPTQNHMDHVHISFKAGV